MKRLITTVLVFGFMSSLAFSQTSGTRERSIVQSANFSRGEGGNQVLEVEYATGGCGQQFNKPRLELKHVSTKDITPQWYLESNPNAIHEYLVEMEVYVVENTSLCLMAYDMKVSSDLTELFKAKAPELGIDLKAKKAHYRVVFKAPTVMSLSSFSAFDEE